MGTVIATPYTKPIYGATFECILYSEPTGKFWSWKRLYGWPIDEAREYFKNYVLKTPEISALMFVDADATFHPKAIKRLYERNLPVVCGTMFTRQLPPQPTIGMFTRQSGKKKFYNSAEICYKIREYIHLHKLDKFVENAVVLPKRDGDLVKVDGCGMHFTMIRREALEAVEEPAFIMGGDTGAGEDFYFCQKAQEAGFDIYWDRSVYTGHLVGEDQDFGLREFLIFDNFFTEGYEAVEWEV